MDNNEINHLDPDDIGLKQIMGNRFHDETKKPMVEPFTRPAMEEKKSIDQTVDASWAPVKNPNWMDNLKSCAKSVILFGGLSFLVFYWKEAGLMAESIAVPAIAVCTALAGFGAGRTVRRGGR
jgi:hypothetical protein